MTTPVLRAAAPPTIAQLVTCDAVALLDGWRDSKGATLEVQIAEALSMLVRPLHVWQAWLVVA